MARNIPYMMHVTQRILTTRLLVVPESKHLLQYLCFKRCLLEAPLSCKLSTSCLRLQHFQSVDSDEEIDEEDIRKVPRSKEHELFLFPVMANKEPLSTKEWTELRNNILNSRSFLKEENIDAIIMGTCIASRAFAVGNSFLDYFRELKIEPNIPTLSRYLRLCYECEAGNEETILNVVNEIRSRCPILDSSTAENVIHGLVLTTSWQDGLELLKDIRLTAVPHMSSFCVLAKAAIENGELAIGWNLIEEMLQADKRPRPDVYNAWIDQCSRTKGSDGKVMISQLLNFWADNDLRPTMDTASKLRNWFEKDNYSWEGCFTSLNPWGGCTNCRTRLKTMNVSREEFEEMREQFFEQAIVGSNVFLKTNPEELETFQQFLSRTAPYDVVVDGLNVGYSTGLMAPQYAAKTLLSVVNQLSDSNSKILVLGRRHMEKWPQIEMRRIHERASVFLAQNVSQDDPFLLYAAMYSGINTKFVSRDLMRGHMFLLKDKTLRRVFLRWQQHRQMQVIPAGRGNVVVKPALNHSTSVQEGPGSVWHIPYDLEYQQQPKNTFIPPKFWLCLMKSEERFINTHN